MFSTRFGTGKLMEGTFQINDNADNGRYRVEGKLNLHSDGSFEVEITRSDYTGNKSSESGAGTYTLNESKVTLNFTSKNFSRPEGNELNFLSSSMNKIEWQGIGMENGHVMTKV
jgi:hypothetical protein